MIKERIKQIQTLMKEQNIGLYVVPTSDYHGSEYVSAFFKVREYLSGFTGSAGTLVIGKDAAYLFADGRYFIQAEKQIAGTGIELMKMGQQGVPTLVELLEKELPDNTNIGADTLLISTALGQTMALIAKKKHGQLIGVDLASKIWKDRPSLPKEKVFILDKKFCGESTKSKIRRIKKVMRDNHASSHVIASLTDIAWILNLRGNDVECTPVFLSYLVINKSRVELFIDQDKLDKGVRDYLLDNGINIHDYDEIHKCVSSLKGTVLIDSGNLNYGINQEIKCKKVDKQYPSTLMKSIKNKVEIKNIKEAHLKDAIAMCKFMYWLKTNIGKENMSEVSVQDYLYDLRAKLPNYVGPSFTTICAYKDHGAMMHYSATKESDVKLKAEGFLLVDSGGHYLEGTTDITRTFALGKLSDEQKKHFTAVLESVINLARAKFLKGCRGINLDVLARGPIWDLLIDYKCGTGHGVSYLMSVHEGPQAFRWQVSDKLENIPALEPGMVTTDEPGIYLEGRYGIRTENELLCKELATNDDGTFLGFECITYVPIDLDAIDPKYLSPRNIEYLNEYHADIYKKVSPYLTKEEKAFLKEYTRAI